MREMKIELPGGAQERYEYAVMMDDMALEGFCCESYGVRVRERVTGWSAEVLHVTTSVTRLEELMDLLVTHRVSPCHLREVIEDWL